MSCMVAVRSLTEAALIKAAQFDVAGLSPGWFRLTKQHKRRVCDGGAIVSTTRIVGGCMWGKRLE